MLSYIIEKDKKTVETIVGLGLILCLFIPFTNIFFLSVPTILCLFFKLFINNKIHYRWTLVVLIALFMTFVINVMNIRSNNELFRFFSLSLTFILFPIIGNVKIKNRFLFIAIGIILLSQFTYIGGINFLARIFDVLYPIGEYDYAHIAYEDGYLSSMSMFNVRHGGLYRNANLCSQYVTLLLCVTILENWQERLSKYFLVFLLAGISIILSGSRTGFAVYAILLFFFILKRKGHKPILKFLILSILLLFFYFVIFYGSEQYRVFNIIEGFDNSIGTKNYVLKDYLNNENSAIKLLFGYFDITQHSSISGAMDYFDAELGNIIYAWGFIGLFALLLFWVFLYKYISPRYRIIFVLLLWSLSTTILYNYRASFLYLLLFSKYYTQSMLGTNNEYQ